MSRSKKLDKKLEAEKKRRQEASALLSEAINIFRQEHGDMFVQPVGSFERGYKHRSYMEPLSPGELETVKQTKYNTKYNKKIPKPKERKSRPANLGTGVYFNDEVEVRRRTPPSSEKSTKQKRRPRDDAAIAKVARKLF